MPITAPPHAQATPTERAWFVAFARSDKPWKLACTTGRGQKPRARGGAARHPGRLLQAVAPAKRRFGLPASAPVVRGDAAGRAGFWRQRFWPAHGLTHPGGDSSSLAGRRRQRRAKSEAWARRQLVRMLRRFPQGAGEGGRVGQVPPVAAADQRHRPRALATLKQGRASPTPRLQGVRRSQGGRLTSLSTLPEPLEALRRWAASPGPLGLRQRWLRVWAHHELLRQQMAAGAAERRALLASSPAASLEKGRQWMPRQGSGSKGAW